MGTMSPGSTITDRIGEVYDSPAEPAALAAEAGGGGNEDTGIFVRAGRESRMAASLSSEVAASVTTLPEGEGEASKIPG
jgi:hypothetical protein